MIDLHLHTTYSDGTWEPEEVVRRANELGISAIAITDHERVAGIEPAKEAADQYGMEIVPGIELFALYNGCEVHILAYYFDYENPDFAEYLKSLEDVRIRQNQIMLDMISKASDVDIPYEMLYEFSPHGFTSRAQIAQVMAKLGIVPETQAAFTDDYIGNFGRCYVPSSDQPPEKVISKIREFGGIPVLAHPGYSGNIDLSDESIAEFRDMGIMGLECRHMRHSQEMSRHFEKLAEDLGLIKTGGSDCHGTIYDPVKIGTVEVPDSWLFNLKV